MSRGRELAKVGGLTQTISGISTFVGISTFGSDVRIHGKLDVDGDISYDEMTSVNSKITGVSTMTDVQITRNLVVTGITTVNGSTFDANGGATINNIQIAETGDNEIDTSSGSLTIDSAGGTVTIDDNLTVTGLSVHNGSVDLGDNTSDTLTVTARIDSDLVPSTDGARDLGTSSLEWMDLHLDGTANIDTLAADTAAIADLTDNRVVIAGTSGELEDDANLTFNGSTLSVGVALDVDGATTLDGLTVAEAATFDVGVTITGALDANGGASIDNVQIGVTGDNEIDTASGNLTLDSAAGTVAVDDNLTVSGNTTIQGLTTLNGGIALGNATSDVITPTARFNADIVPASDGAVDLGTSALEFQDLFIDGTANIDSLAADTAAIGDLTANRIVYAGSSGELQDSGNLTYNGSALTHTGTTTLDGDVNFNGATYSALWDFSENSLEFSDNAILSLGTGKDLTLYHNGTAGYIDSTGNDTLFIRNGTSGGSIKIQGNSGEESIIAKHDGAVELYHDGTKRFETSSVGGTLTGKLTVTGDLQIDGTTTTVNSTTMTVDDKNITLGSGAANDAACDGSGITAESADGNKTWNWVDATDAWTSSEHIDLANGKTIKHNTNALLSSTTLGSTVVNSSLTTLGTIGTGVWNGTAIANDYIATITSPNKVSLSSLNLDGGTDIGAALADADLLIVDDGAGGTNRKMTASRLPTYLFGKVSGDVLIAANGAATIQANSVALTTDTTGNYVAAGAVSGNGLSGSAGAEGATFTVTSNATNANTGSTIVFRDSSGDFSAGTITASLTGNASGSSGSCTGNAATATALANARNIGGVSFDGTAAINLPGVNAVGNQNTSGNAATATEATNVTATANNTANETVYITFVDGVSGTQGIETDSNLTYNPSTNTLTAGVFVGSLTGTASNAALLDSLDSSQFVRSDTADTITATLTARAITPQADSTYDLGTNSVRWANVYADDVRTGDLHLSNEHRGGNTIDGSWGHYTIMEGEDDLFITNKRSGKKFRFVLEQV